MKEKRFTFTTQLDSDDHRYFYIFDNQSTEPYRTISYNTLVKIMDLANKELTDPKWKEHRILDRAKKLFEKERNLCETKFDDQIYNVKFELLSIEDKISYIMRAEKELRNEGWGI